MSKIILGTVIPGGKNVGIDIPELLTTRLLVQANSGGGKSWLLRRMAEQLYGKVQTIIIDPEGEFFTLREKFGYVLVGEGGETPADVRSAALLAQKFMELKISAVCDLFEAFRSRPTERRRWVRDFLNALLEVPRSLWNPLIVIIDEAHKFCPQETPKAGSMTEREIISGCKDAMIALSTTGRKRGFCPVWATQRLAKLDKDASAELFNRLVGMTIEDVDVDRAADLMSVSKEDKHDFRTSLRTLDPGQFYAFGRAISKVRILLKSGDIQTRHPESGAAAKYSAPPPMPEAVAKLLPKLADLPKEAEDKARSEQELKREIRELKQKIASSSSLPARSQKPEAAAKADPQQARTIRELRSLLAESEKMLIKLDIITSEADAGPNPAELSKVLNTRLETREREFNQARRALTPLLSRLNSAISMNDPTPTVAQASKPEPTEISRVPHASPNLRSVGSNADANADGNIRLGGLHLQVAGILAGYHPQSVSINLLAAMCARTPGGSFSARLSEVRGAGLLIDPEPGSVKATEKCVHEYLGTFTPPSTTAEVLELWDRKLATLHKQILDHLIKANGEPVAIDELAAALGRTPGGSFSARLSEIRAKNLLVDPRRGYVAANKEALFLNGEAA